MNPELPGRFVDGLVERWGSYGAPEVVRVEELAPVVERWCDNWDAIHDERQKKFENQLPPMSEQVTQMGSKAWLAMKTGIDERKIYGILNREYKHLPLAQADAILSAMNSNEMLTTGEVQVIANPKWTIERWIAYMEEKGCA